MNDLYESFRVLEPIMFADSTNLFFSHKDIKQLFQAVNFELAKIRRWFKKYEPSLNKGNTKCTLFHEPTNKDNIYHQNSEMNT